MPDENELVAVARAIVDAGLYLVLGTADESGRPWVTPVYYAPASYRDFLRVSAPEARHSMNLEARPEASIVIFDSSAPIGTVQAVYMSATARQLGDDELAEQIDVFSRRSLSHGAREWTPEDVHQPARLRLYRATAVEQYVLDERDSRVSVTP